MNILFVQTNSNRMLVPLPIGAAMVARTLQTDGHRVRFLDLMGEKNPASIAGEVSAELQPDLVCYSVRNRDNQSMLDYHDPLPEIQKICEAVRAVCRAPALLGGTAFTTFPERMLEYLGAEYGIAGDAMDPVSRFVASLEAGSADMSTPGLVFRGDDGAVITNPFHLEGYASVHCDYHTLIDRRRYRRCYWDAAIITRSGCPEKCAYCDTFTTFGRSFILREPSDIAAEMLKLKRFGEARSVWMVDAGFNRPLDHAKEVLREIIRTGAQLRLYAVFDPGEADREFFRLYRKAGGVGFTLFAESLSDPVLEALGKSFGTAEIFRDTTMMREEGLFFMAMPTFGSPGETRATVEETLRLAPSLKAVFTEFGIGWRIQPGTPLQQRAIDEGIISVEDDLWEAKFYVSPQTPIDWLKRRINRFRLRHVGMYARALPALLSMRMFTPWKWEAQEVN
ncbi:MAG: cobalamin-dependent protein [Bacteroidia bacterium]|nr:cobalamin-dependent protein [Bacteroidia bacterium]